MEFRPSMDRWGHSAREAVRGSALTLLFIAFASAVFSAEGTAQVRTDVLANPQTALRVFLDCQGQVPCDRNHFRTEIQWINWMNDREDADVHMIITSEAVGGGGRRFNLDFIGREAMEHLTDALTYTSSGTDVEIETLDGITQAMRLGLMRYAVESGLGAEFEVNFDRTLASTSGAGDAASGTPEAPAFYDPWNYWTFRAGLQGNMSVEELRKGYRFNPSFGADRVTENWKFNFFANLNLNRETTTFPATATSPERDVVNNRDGWNANTTLVRSINSHTSMGATFGGGSSTQNNRKVRVTVTPAIEWNYYPYVEANRRQLIAYYSAGVQFNKYEEETVFGVTQETIPLHRIGVQYRAVEGWGNAGISLDASQYLHESGLYSLGASGNISFRLIRGLELSFSASGQKIEDQIHIQASDFDEEDVLLGNISLPTSYNYQASIGLNYRWGSSFSNIVNTRFPQSVR